MIVLLRESRSLSYSVHDPNKKALDGFPSGAFVSIDFKQILGNVLNSEKLKLDKHSRILSIWLCRSRSGAQ